MAARRFDQPDPLILSIDAGTTGVTALLVDDSAQVVASGYREFTQHFPADDQVEHELGDIWAATVAATEEALTQIDRHHQSTRNLVLVGQGNDGFSAPRHRVAGPSHGRHLQ
jgi:glycerol kinase